MVRRFPLVILFLLWATNQLAYSQIPVAKYGCKETCGDFTIRYPFGMGDPNCYADKWFEVECRNASQDLKPFLKSLNLEVRYISVATSKIQVFNPIYRLNCGDNRTAASPGIDFTESPFVYSQEENKFVAAGCNSAAFLDSNSTTVGGCVSICDNKKGKTEEASVSDGCHGRYCCETYLPMYLSNFNTSFTELGGKNGRNGCIYAMIVERDCLDYSSSSYYYSSSSSYCPSSYTLDNIKHLSHVPAVLEWEIINSTLQLPKASNCVNSNVTSANKDHSGQVCRCYPGFYGNPYLDGGCIGGASFRAMHKNVQHKWIIVGVSSSLGSIVLLVGLWWLYKIVKKRRIQNQKDKFFKQNGGLLLQKRLSSGEANVEKTTLFALKELEKATDHFNTNRILGKGGQGTVYKGMLVDGKIVAVKKFKLQGNAEEFINEFIILSQINHRNVVKLLGCCLETKVPLLVYEFIPNGTVFQYLHEPNQDFPMTWEMRLRIATEIAGALFYLHSAASQPIYHRDIKSANILLDEKFRAKIADFGTSRMVSIEDTHLTTRVQGTFGYLDPEYFHTSQFTEKSDVYSFGVVLVELLTGQKPISSIRPEEGKSLASYFIMRMEENHLFDIVDERVKKEGHGEHIMAVAYLAKRCLNLSGRKRPTMREVTMELEAIQKFGKNSDNSHQNYEEIDLVEGDTFQSSPALDSTTIAQAPKWDTSSSSEVLPLVHFK